MKKGPACHTVHVSELFAHFLCLAGRFSFVIDLHIATIKTKALNIQWTHSEEEDTFKN